MRAVQILLSAGLVSAGVLPRDPSLQAVRRDPDPLPAPDPAGPLLVLRDPVLFRRDPDPKQVRPPNHPLAKFFVKPLGFLEGSPPTEPKKKGDEKKAQGLKNTQATEDEDEKKAEKAKKETEEDTVAVMLTAGSELLEEGDEEEDEKEDEKEDKKEKKKDKKKDDKKKEKEKENKKPLGKRQIQAWNEFSSGLTHLDACVILKSLEWLAYSLLEPTEDITAEAGARVFVAPEEQGGPLVLDMRAMMIWEAILERFKAQLQATNIWSREAQLRVAECYLGAGFQAGAFLTSLRAQAKDFADTSAARCLMYDKIEALYMAYDDVATLIYGGNTGTPSYVQALITDNFPAQIPQDFDSPYTAPTGGTPIAAYVALNDDPLPSSRRALFAQNQAQWQCKDYDGAQFVFVQPQGLVADAAPKDAGKTAEKTAAKGDGKTSTKTAGKTGRRVSELAKKAGDFSGKAGEKIEELGRKLGIRIEKDK